jgi:hypothetical protein
MSGSTLNGSYRYYYCRRTRLYATNPDRCEARYVRADRLEQQVIGELTRTLQEPDVVLAELMARQAGGFPELDERIRHLSSQIRASEEQEKRLIRLFRYGEVDDDFIRKEAKTLQAKKTRLSEELDELKTRHTNLERMSELAPRVKEVCRQIRSTIASFGFQEKQLILDAFSIKVRAFRDRSEVSGALPPYVTIARTSA